MFFVVSKLAAFVEQPLNWVLALLVISWVLRKGRPATARLAARAAVLLFLLIGVTFAPLTLLRWLEDRHPPTTTPIESFHGLVVLGGSTEAGNKMLERGQVPLNDSVERLTEALRLMRHHPRLVIVYTGFSGALSHTGASEAAVAARFFTEQGGDVSRVIYEDRSRNTHENAAFSMQLPQVDHRRPWLLITSAVHMPRSLAVFRKLGWNVEPYAVDYKTTASTRYWSYSIASGAFQWEAVLHELFGLLAYKATGRL
jgi:uncharacterized SAM-binding protein YcdF (DUF218 family)